MIRGNGLTSEQAKQIKANQYFEDNGYVWQLRSGKTLEIFRSNQRRSNPFLLNDVWPFFQRTFIMALDEYFGKSWPHRDNIVRMKAERGNFDRLHDDEVIEYNNYELELLVMLMEELRDRLFAAGMQVNKWYGPGAIASGLLNQWKIKDTLVDYYTLDPGLADAGAHAYAGGRFEMMKCGHMNTPVYQYDINSAYPWAIAQLPNLAKGRWEYHLGGTLEDLTEYSIARIQWTNHDGYMLKEISEHYPLMRWEYPEAIPFPFWKRSKIGNISYPSGNIHGWYWAPEILAGFNYVDSLPEYYDRNIRVLEYYKFIDESGERPFAQVEQLYKTRQVLKSKGNGAHVGIKLGLNSLYGKLAQQIGWTEERPNKPPFHNILLAGYVTAKCRAKILDAMALNPAAIISVETDGIFSTMPLDLPVSKELGDWEHTKYDDMYYFQSGLRFGIVDGEVVKPATRGIAAKDINLEAIIAAIKDSASEIEVPVRQFYTLQWALHLNKPQMAGQWKDTTKRLHLMAEDIQGKRIHDQYCYECIDSGDGIRKYTWGSQYTAPHITIPQPNLTLELSYPHKIAWMDGSIDKMKFLKEDDGLEY
jgi:hypothetical protein